MRIKWGEKVIWRKRAKEFKWELGQLKKEMIRAGCEKERVNRLVEELGETLELVGTLATSYVKAREHLGEARRVLCNLLDEGAEKDAETESSLFTLAGHLEGIYHECLIQDDDLDFQSTVGSLKKMAEERRRQKEVGSKASQRDIMLRSELENISAILDEAAGWQKPDFFALSYFFLHENKEKLRAMDHEQMNTYAFTYVKEHFMDSFLEECYKTGAEEMIQEMFPMFCFSQYYGAESII